MKRIFLIICALILTISAQAQEKLNYQSNGETVEFTISLDEMYVEFSENKKSIVQRQAKEKFESLTNNSAILKTTGTSNSIKNRKQNLNSQFNNIFKRVEPVLIYKDGVKQILKGELNIKLKQGVSLNKVLKNHNFKSEIDKFVKNQFLVQLDLETSELFQLINELQKDTRIEFAEPNFIRMLEPHTNDPFLNSQWSINNQGHLGGTVDADMDVDEAWCFSTGTNIKIAIIDEGVDLTHSDLTPNLLPGYDATGNGSNGAPSNNDAHGTACAGIVAAVNNNNIGITGVAYNSKILPVRIAIGQPDGDWQTSDTWIANGINWAWQNGADVLSNSWGGGSPSNTISNAITNAVTNGRNGLGSVVLFSSGNNNGGVSFPATLDNVIAVGASSMCDERKTPTSCDGETWWGSNYGSQIDIIAPGVKIYTTDISGSAGYVSGDFKADFNGTSAACPNAAGVAALILSVNPNLTQTQARKILETTTDKISSYTYNTNVIGQPNGTWNDEIGYGRVNANSAVIAAVGLSINGPTLICNSEVYSIDNLPAGATVTWSVPSNTGPVLQLSQNTPTANQLTIINHQWYSITRTLTATIDVGCDPITITKTIANDKSSSIIQYGSYSQVGCYVNNVYQPSKSGTLNGNTIFLSPFCMATVTLSNMVGRTVSFSGSTQPLYWSYYNNKLFLQLPLGSGGTPFTFIITGDGACNQKSIVFFTTTVFPRYMFSVSPNPVSNILTINVKSNEEQMNMPLKTELGYSINISDVNTGESVLKKEKIRGNMKHQINISKLNKGYYVLQIIEGGEKQEVRFLKK